MVYYVHIARHIIGIDVPYPLIVDPWLSEFLTPKADMTDIYCEVIVGELPDLNGWKLLADFSPYQLWKRNEMEAVRCRLSDGSGEACCLIKSGGLRWKLCIRPDMVREYDSLFQILSSMDLEPLFLSWGSLIMHASYIIQEGRAILFTAPSTYGKSTQAELWRRYKDAEIMNGDRVLLTENDGVLYADGLPFHGSSAYCRDRRAPVRCIVLLGKAPCNKVTDAKKSDAVKFIYSQIGVRRWDPEGISRSLGILDGMIDRTMVVRMDCRPDREAVEMLYDHIGWKESNSGEEKDNDR